jgi:hypothetical protein
MTEIARNPILAFVSRTLHKALSALLPAATAATLVFFEPTLSAWLVGRESVLPIAMLLILTAMVQPALRRFFVVALCYGVAFLALRDSQHIQPLPDLVNYDLLVEVRPAVLLAIAALALVAAISETVRPGTVWARRCYFGAAALYFTGLGIISCGWRVTWQSVMLCITGICAFAAFVLAHRISVEDEPQLPVISDDELVQRELEDAHRRVLRAKEWHDSPNSLLAAEADPVGPQSVSSS